jgi:hypothetical protein
MFIINQDRDRMVKYIPDQTRIGTIIVEGKLMGFGVYHKTPEDQAKLAGTPLEAFDHIILPEILIGSYDTYEECEDLVDMINRNEKPFFVAPGFGDYDYDFGEDD